MNAPRRVHRVSPGKPRLLDQVRETIRVRHYSRRTEAAYVGWIKRYIFFHGTRQPATGSPLSSKVLSAAQGTNSVRGTWTSEGEAGRHLSLRHMPGL
jgi:hypothetical protein